MKISLEEVKRQLIEINPKDFFTNTELKEIFKTSTNFKLDVGRKEKYINSSDESDKMLIQITFDWEACSHPKKYGYDQKWYIDLEKYKKSYRQYKIKKLLKKFE